MTRRLRIALWLSPVLLAGLAAVFVLFAASWIQGSATGARWVFGAAEAAAGPGLRFDGVSGNFREGVTVNAVQWKDEGLLVAVDDVRITAQLELLPPTVRIGALSAGSVSVVEQPGAAAAQPLDLEALLDSLALPVLVEITDARVGPITVQTGAEEATRLVDSARVAGTWSDGLRIDALEFAGDGFAGEVVGTLELNGRNVHDLTGSLGLVGSGEDLGALTLRLAGDQRSSGLALAWPGLGLEADGALRTPFARPTWDVSFTLDDLALGEPVSLRQLAGTVTGPFQAYMLDATAVLDPGTEATLALALSARGDFVGLPETGLEVGSKGVTAAWDGVVSWASGFRVRGPVTFEASDLAVIGLEAEAVPPLRGEAMLDLTVATLELTDLALAAEASPATVTGRGRLGLEDGQVDADLAWRSFTWPLVTASAETEAVLFTSPEGEAHLAGQVDGWFLTAQMALDAPDYPGGEVRLSATGDRERATVTIDRAAWLGGTIVGGGEVGFSGEPTWRADLELADIDLSPIWSAWPSRLSGRVRTVRSPEGAVDVTLDGITGRLRGAPLEANGRVALVADVPSAEGLRLRAGRSRLDADGAWAAGQGVTLQLDLPPGDWPAEWLGGDLRGELFLAPADGLPRMQADLRGSGGSLGPVTAAAWSLQGDSAAEGLTLSVGAVEAGVLALDAFNVVLGTADADGAIPLDIELLGGPLRWTSRLEVAPVTTATGDIEGWDGRLESWTIHREEQALLTLEQPAAFTVAADDVRVDRACIRTEPSGRLCAEGAWNDTAGVTIDGEVDDLSLAILNPLVIETFNFTQRVNGVFRWSRQGAGPVSGTLDLDLSEGVVTTGDESDLPLETGPGIVAFELVDGNLRSGHFDVPLPGFGFIDVDLEASGIDLSGSGRLNGRARLDIDDLAALEVLTAALDNLGGQLEVELDIRGTVLDPVIDGQVLLVDGRGDLPFFGLQVTGLQAEGYARGKGEASLQASFNAGEGAGQLFVDVDLTPGGGNPFGMRVQGERLRLFETPDLVLDADADLDLSWSDRGWLLNGTLGVPHARLTPVSSFVGRVSESEDVQVVAGVLPEATAKTRADEVRVFGAVDLLLGEDVRFETDQARASVGGALNLAWDGPPMPTTNGALAINGAIELFGPVLNIQNGAIRFPGVPLNNPVLDLRAERDIFGNTQIHTAGVLVTGTARRPEIEAYTRPFTTRERAWTLLITGQDFEQGQNIGALEVGTYIAPRVYVGYGVSLFDDENVVSVRYDLRRGFGIKATSGQRQSGIDMSYTVDR